MQLDYLQNDQDYQEKLLECIENAGKSSAIAAQFKNELYFSHGHSRCLSNGNYDPIQCVDFKGGAQSCVCVLPWTDENHLEPNGTVAFPETITDLHCFNETLHSKDYYRPCEQLIHNLEVCSKY